MADQSEITAEWTSISFRVGGILPSSTLVATVQMVGALDVLLRSMESDFRRAWSQRDETKMFETHYQVLLSGLWIGSAYEIFRLLRERTLGPHSKEFDALARDLKLVRIPLEKLEIADDRHILDPITMRRMPAKHDETDYDVYDPVDRGRSHIMPVGHKDGSVAWYVLDGKTMESRWIHRISLADRILALWR
jgi:hypothetical protein